MSLAVRTLELGLAHAVWANCGVALTALAGMLCFSKAFHALRLAGLALIVACVATLNISAR